MRAEHLCAVLPSTSLYSGSDLQRINNDPIGLHKQCTLFPAGFPFRDFDSWSPHLPVRFFFAITAPVNTAEHTAITASQRITLLSSPVFTDCFPPLSDVILPAGVADQFVLPLVVSFSATENFADALLASSKRTVSVCSPRDSVSRYCGFSLRITLPLSAV